MACKAFHETGITVSATMPASHIRIDAVIETRDGCFGQNGFGKDFPYLHKIIMRPTGLGFKGSRGYFKCGM